MAHETTLKPSWLLLLRNTAIGAGLAVCGYFLLQTEETILLILGGCMIFTGPIMVALPLFMGLPARGPCPQCGGTIETVSASDANMLCRGCASYLDAGGGKLRLADSERIAEEPKYAAPTPWTDLTNIIFPTVALSASDAIQDFATTKRGGVRVMDARWPQSCCVCGKKAARFDTITRTISKPGNIVDTQIVLVAKDVPHCAEHKNGLTFDRVMSATPGADGGFGVLFRSLAYRNAFMKQNPWPFTWRDAA